MSQGDVSLSFCEVNEVLETSLAIETPDEMSAELLSASYVDLHRPGTAINATMTSFSEEGEMLDILCELADAHGPTEDSNSSRPATPADSNAGSQQSKTSVLSSRTPRLEWTSSSDSVEESPYDNDSILGSQCFRTNKTLKEFPAPSVPISDSSDEEKETFEMSQIFDSGEDLFSQETSKYLEIRSLYLFVYHESM